MRTSVIAAASLLATCLSAGAAEVGGRYEARGTNSDGSRYSGTATITRTGEHTCRLEWNVGSTSAGICMLAGSVFVAGYELKGSVGLVVYEVRDDGTLDGRWTIDGEDGFGTELLIPR
jgi:hypothetical protein